MSYRFDQVELSSLRRNDLFGSIRLDALAGHMDDISIPSALEAIANQGRHGPDQIYFFGEIGGERYICFDPGSSGSA